MRKVGIITDSAADLPPEVLQEQKIKEIPLKITFGREIFRDGIDLSPAEFYNKMEESTEMPTISSPSAREFLEAFERLKEEGYDGAVCIIASNNIVKVFNAACEARDLALPFPVMVVESHAATMNQGFLVLEAARAADQGFAIGEIVERLWQIRPHIRFWGVVSVLHFMVRACKISKGSAFMRALFNVKPIITIDEEGAVDSVDKVRSFQQGIAYLLREIEKETSRDGKLHVAVLHAGEKEIAESLLEEISSRHDCFEKYLCDLTPAIGSFTGPGVAGVSYYIEK